MAKPKKKFNVVVNEEWCKGCVICVDVCPTKVLDMKEMLSKWEGSVAEVVAVDKCIGCNLCELSCPDFAIEVFELPVEQEADSGK